MTDDKKEQLPREFFGISELEERELLRGMGHVETDYRYTKMTEPEFISKLFPDVSKKDKLKILYFGRTQWHWGFDFAKRDP
jgi:hypothetical protein